MTRQLPRGWLQAALGDLVQVQYGRACPESERIIGCGGYPVVGSAGALATARDALVAEECLVVGRKGNAGAVHALSGGCWPTDTTYYLVMPPEVELRYLLHYLQRSDLRRLDSSSTTPSLRRPDLEAVVVPVPPLAEQRRIVALLDAQHEQSVRLRAGCEGIRQKSLALKTALSRRFLAAPGEPTVSIGDIATVGSGATPARTNAAFWSEGKIPWLTSGDLNQRQVTCARQFITEAALAETAVRYWPSGTLLVAMYGEGQTRGRCSQLRFTTTTNQACAGILPKQGSPVGVDFLQGYFEATYQRNRGLAAGGVQPNLSLGLLKNMRVPVRTIAEQGRLVADYEAALEELEASAHALSRLRRQLDALWLAIRASALAGASGTQDQADLPSQALLERLQMRGERTTDARRKDAGTVRRNRTTMSVKSIEETA